jgi:hypothetical protein
MKIKSACLALTLCLLAASTAEAQFGGGHGGGGRGGGGQPSSAPSSGGGGGPPAGKVVPPDQVDIVGVIQSIDPATDRVTIAYQPVDALDWPAGTKPFEVAKSALLSGVTVGEKVRFRLESQQIYVLQPFVAGQGSGSPQGRGPS